ncbi:MAG TPA: peptidylprolyl isomerase [Candidatus Dormibacteraeota bacterium]|nr:peptidylprolyl isomerase [Candidatus Dormibacteraeota bacterium]
MPKDEVTRAAAESTEGAVAVAPATPEAEDPRPDAGGGGEGVTRRTALALLAGVTALVVVAAGGLGLWLHSRGSGGGPSATSPASTTSICPTSASDHPIGTVRGDPLLSSVFDGRMCASIVGAEQGGAPGPSSPAYAAFLAALRDRVLKSYVFDTITAQEARLHNTLAAQSQVDAEVQADVTAAGGRDALTSQLAQAGATEATLEDETRSRLNEANLVDLLAGQRAADVVARLKAGLPFDQAARQFSDDAGTSANGGVLGKVTIDQLNAGDPTFKQAVLQMHAGDLSVTPIRDAQGYVVVYCDAADATSRTLRVIRVAAPNPYTTKERPNWFAEFIFLDIQGDCDQGAIQVSEAGLASPCTSLAPTPAPGATPSPATGAPSSAPPATP